MTLLTSVFEKRGWRGHKGSPEVKNLKDISNFELFEIRQIIYQNDALDVDKSGQKIVQLFELTTEFSVK